MTTPTELLQRALDELNRDGLEESPLIDDIQAFLAAPALEPVDREQHIALREAHHRAVSMYSVQGDQPW